MRRGIATAAFVIAAMALGRLITDHVPLDDVADTPFIQEGAVGKVVSLEYADVTVTGIHVSPTITGNPAAEAGGRWLVVDTEIVAKQTPQTMDGFFLVDGQDRRYVRSPRGTDCGSSVQLATGVPAYASFCFDLPRKALEGARLLATRGAYDSHEGLFRRDDLADIDLGVSASEVATLWDQTDAVDVRPRGFTPPEVATP